MQAVLKIIQALWQLSIRLVIFYVIFVGIAWIVLGMSPRENWRITHERLQAVSNFITGFSRDTTESAGGLAKLGEKHLNQAQDRYHGIDPYENYNRSLDAQNQSAQ